MKRRTLVGLFAAVLWPAASAHADQAAAPSVQADPARGRYYYPQMPFYGYPAYGQPYGQPFGAPPVPRAPAASAPVQVPVPAARTQPPGPAPTAPAQSPVQHLAPARSETGAPAAAPPAPVALPQAAQTAAPASGPQAVSCQLSERDLGAVPGLFRGERARLGSVLASGSGRTLYVSDRDLDGRSLCTGDCTRYWLPLPMEAEETPAPPFGAALREDGTRQWSCGGMPLYLWFGDRGAGDVTGDGVDGTWHAVRIGAPGHRKAE